jgi:hypothetical protein
MLCLRYTTEQALTVFKPMIQAVAFDPHSLPNWKWSAQPGAVERHLQRRRNNPLFPLHRRMVTSSDVYEARLADNRALADIRQDLAEVAREFFDKTGLPPDWHSFLKDLRERLDKLEERRLVAGGRTLLSPTQLPNCAATSWQYCVRPFKRTGRALPRSNRRKHFMLNDMPRCMPATGRLSY